MERQTQGLSLKFAVIEFGLVGKTMHKIDENVEVNDIINLTKIYNQFLFNYFGVKYCD